MSTTEIKNLTAKCLDRDNPDLVVLHEVEFEWNDGTDGWHPDVVLVMATDPMNAINTVRSRHA